MDAPTYHVFLSYNHRDSSTVESIADALQRAGLRPWLDKHQIAPGRRFPEALDEGISRSAACAICIGPHGLGDWGREELNLARHRDINDAAFRVFAVLLPGLPSEFDRTSMPPSLNIRNVVDLRGGLHDRPAFQSLIAAISPNPSERPEPPVDHARGGHTRMIDSQPHPWSSPLTADSYLSDNVRTLQQHIKALTFTPILGAGCSLVGRTRGEAWTRIGERIEALLSLLESDELASRYLRSMAAVPVYDVSLRASHEEADRSLADDPLARLQIALVKLGAELGVVFAQTMMQSGTPVWDTPSYKLTIPRDRAEHQTMSRLLIDACVAAYDAAQLIPEAKDPASGLEAPGLYERLVELAAELTADRPLESLPGMSNGHPRGDALHTVLHDLEAWRRRRTRREAPDGVELSLHHLEWIADALWHTLRHDQAAYPRSDELAFQISLLASGARGRRPELGAAAEAGRVMLSPTTVAAWFRQYSGSPTADMVAFYDALARILLAQFKGFQSPSSRPTSALGGQPVAFSTTYDLELERAMHRLSDLAAYHIVIPVNAFAPGDSRPELKWLLGTARSQVHAPEQAAWKWLPDDWRPYPDDIEGPILIKLHGSPLHELPAPDRLSVGQYASADYERLEHVLVLSESEYLQNIVWKDTLPAFFNMILLQRHRALFFLGHSLTQWNTRLRLFSQVYRPDSRPRETDRIAISRSHDPYHSAVLSAFGIHRWIGDLDEIPRVVNSMPL